MAHLRQKLDTFEKLISLLPASLPLVSSGNIIFGLDADDIADIGIAGALNRCFELNWGMRAHGFRILERGDKLKTTISVFREVLIKLGPHDDWGLIDIWLDTFINLTTAAAINVATVADTDTAANNKLESDTRAVVQSTSCASPGLAVDTTSSGRPIDHPGTQGCSSSDVVPPTRRHVPVEHNLRQAKLPFQKITGEAWVEQQRREQERLGARIRHDLAKEALRKQKKEDMKRAYEREKKSKQRFRAKWAKGAVRDTTVINIDDSDEDETPDQSTSTASPAPMSAAPPPVTSPPPCGTTATTPTDEASSATPAAARRQVSTQVVSHRMHHELAKHTWSASNTSHRRDLKYQRAVKAATANGKAPLAAPAYRLNWQQYPYWVKITAAQERLRTWSPTQIVNYLQRTDTALFSGLHVGTVGKWIVNNGNGGKMWSHEVIERAKAGRRIGITSRSKALSAYPHIQADIVSQLQALRLAGVAVQSPLVMAVVRAHIEHKAPHLLQPGSAFKLSSSWVHRFTRDVLNWTSRKSTRAARKVPPNGEDLCELAFLRMVFAIKFHNIKPSMIVNADQAGVLLMPSGKQTYEVKGAKNVPVHGHDEKRQMTIVVASSLDGKMLPFQSVWGGNTDASLPARTAPRRAEADELGFVYAHGDTRHWSSRETTKKWINEVLDPFLARQRAAADPPLPEDEKALLLIDVWPVHIAKKSPDDWLPWMKVTHKNTIIIFVPGGCTGLFQPADVGLQRLVKHIIRRSAVDFLVAAATRKLVAGMKADDILLPTDMASLRNASIAWLLDTYSHLQSRPDIIKKAWAKCEAKGWNLSYESLTSKAALDHLEQVMASNPDFAAEFAKFDAVSGDLSEEIKEVTEVGHDDDLALDFDTLARESIGCSHSSAAEDTVDLGSDEEFTVHTTDLDDLEAVETPPLAAPVVPAPALVPSLSTPTSTSESPALPPPPVVQSHSLRPVNPSIPKVASSEAAGEPRPLSEGHTSVAGRHPTYLFNVAVSGGTNYAAICTEDQLRVTDKRKRTSNKALASSETTRIDQAVDAGPSGSNPHEKGKHGATGIKRKRPEDGQSEEKSQPNPSKLMIRIRPRQSVQKPQSEEE